MRLVAGNWKMHGDRQGAIALAEALAALQVTRPASCAVALCPPAVHLAPVAASLEGRRLQLGAQDCSDEKGPGAFTGEVSAAMLADLGCRYVIVGHSERRTRHRESDETVRRKTERALEAGLIPIVCVGETLAERERGEAEAVVHRQVRASLPETAASHLVVVAYEPVWAIGTGKTAQAVDVQAMHDALRQWLGDGVPLLYGGSVKAESAGTLMALPNVDGALVGGASLKAAEFWAIVQACT